MTRAAIAEASRPHSIDLETRERWFVTEYTSMANSDRFRGPLIVDPATGRLARRALVCDAADCPSRSSELSDRLFSYRYPGAYATGDGMVEWTGTPEDFPRVCPWCRRAADVRPHFEGEVAIRRQELEHELQAAQVAWSKARREKQRRPTDYRSPTEIARELSELPAVYLVE
ncbi:MAG: hypothetical protein MI757_03570 [Pirellulales bacterium]|nr:hypothetical protein [Pirellulales bacterium]